MKSSLITSALALAGSALGASLEQVNDFGENSSNTRMYIYVPDTLADQPPIIVAIHYCTGTANAYYTGSPYAKLADQHGFIVIYPESPYEGGCWDVSSQSALTHNGGGDSNSIANMVEYTLKKYAGDAEKVFVTGSSSGAMMTNVMAATYPGLFRAATVYSGVPAGCFLSTADQVNGWNSTCAQGNSVASAEQWANVVKAMYPDFDGSYPRMQIYHGGADDTLLPQNYEETVKQWTGVFGFDPEAPEESEEGVPQSGYTTETWGVGEENPLGTVQGIYVPTAGHTVPIDGDQDMKWFGLA